MADLVHKDLSYKLIGALFDVYNELGGGYQEKYYQRAVALALRKNKILFKELVPVDLSFDNQTIGRYYLDFIIDNKIVLEIKVTPRFYIRHIRQVLAYLKANDLGLGILVSFTRNGVIFKRILRGKNISDYS